MTREEFYKLTDILDSEVLGNFMHGGEADELIAMFEEAVEHSNILEQEEPVSEDLDKDDSFDELLQELYIKYNKEVSIEKLLDIASNFVKWKKELDQSTIELAEDHAMLAGMEKMKDQMMKDAVERTVKVDAGGYPYIDCDGIELYDYENDKPLARKGQKAKVIIILED